MVAQSPNAYKAWAWLELKIGTQNRSSMWSAASQLVESTPLPPRVYIGRELELKLTD